MPLDGISFTKFNDRVTENGQQDQIAHLCKLILLYTLENTRKSMVVNDRIWAQSTYTIYRYVQNSLYGNELSIWHWQYSL